VIASATLLASLSLLSLGACVLISVWGMGRSPRRHPRQHVEGLGVWALALLPAAVRERLSRNIAQADLDDRWDTETWVGLQVLAVLVAGGAALVALAAAKPWVAGLSIGLGLSVWGASWLRVRRRRQDCERRILKDLPAYLDVLTVCVEAGATLHMAVRIAVEKAAPSAVRRIFDRLLREIRMGRGRVEALNRVATLYEIEALNSLVAALVQSEGHGMSLGTVLRAQSQQRATERQLRAEKAAMKAPVKMLGPLVLCIFPCTFIVIAVPVVVRMFGE
jgi:tight adherence protein C